MRLTLFNNTKITKGSKRSLICDTYKQVYFVMPNSVIYFLDSLNNNSIESLIRKFPENEKVINDYINFFISNKLGFLTHEKLKNQFVKPNDDFESTSTITNSIIEVSKLTKPYLKRILFQLFELGCCHIELRFLLKFSNADIQILKKILILFPQISFQIIGLANINIHIKVWDTLLKGNKNFASLLLFNFNTDLLNRNNCPDKFFFSESTSFSRKNCGLIESGYFTINENHFNESLSFNSCLNKKISIDEFGDVKNCPSMSHSFGNIFKLNLLEIVQKKEFLKYWYIKKDNIEVCNICEFRNICTDCRAYLQTPSNIFSKPLKCGYDPTTAVWNDWHTSKISLLAISFYQF
ncbi:MAG: grasp-with-spasm system SPASM domain peptide maturase [Sediminibacterium sp.]|nr:grasp-with-spasm system SPASM domain peptide maturase [Sediminibacterium sp.]TXT28696.1 MAG: hypothetical protein FD136_1965 [Chitinophagaceae bacterium]